MNDVCIYAYIYPDLFDKAGLCERQGACMACMAIVM